MKIKNKNETGIKSKYQTDNSKQKIFFFKIQISTDLQKILAHKNLQFTFIHEKNKKHTPQYVKIMVTF